MTPEQKAVENEILDRLLAPLRPVMRQILVRLQALWPEDGREDVRRVAASMIAMELTKLSFGVAEAQAAIERAAGEVYAIGLRPYGVAVLPLAGPDADLGSIVLKRVTSARIGLFEARTIGQAIEATKLADPAPVIRREVATRIHTASETANRDVSEARPDLVRIFVAERNACLRCLSYQGAIEENGFFPPPISFVGGALGQVGMPPLVHPNCLCATRLTSPDAAASLAKGLTREAKRSVLRGFSLPSESERSRLDAARRLLETPNGLPKSVQEYARNAIKRGAFPDRGPMSKES